MIGPARLLIASSYPSGDGANIDFTVLDRFRIEMLRRADLSDPLRPARTARSGSTQNEWRRIPPSTSITVPVMYLARGDARKVTALATSCGWPKSRKAISRWANF